jgi:hypothetical protein
MNEENSSLEENPHSIEQSEWQASPQEMVKAEEPAQMSEVGTLGSIFFEPGKTFEDLRRKPRFLLAGLIIIIATSLFQIALIEKIGFERMIRERMESNSRVQQMSTEDKQKLIEQQTQPYVKYITYGSTPLVMLLVILLGGLIYWLGANAMGGDSRFPHGISAWVYSSLPPTVAFVLANLLVLFLKSVDDIDLANSQSGLIQANPSFFIDGKTSPVLAALMATFDFFSIWGWILAAIGLQKLGKISAGAAWAIVLIVALVGVAFRVVMALFS